MRSVSLPSFACTAARTAARTVAVALSPILLAACSPGVVFIPGGEAPPTQSLPGNDDDGGPSCEQVCSEGELACDGSLLIGCAVTDTGCGAWAPKSDCADLGLLCVPTALGAVCAEAEPTCDDGTRNQGEGGVDCGGPCDACGDGASCDGDDDCLTGWCAAGLCQPSVCGDEMVTGGEACDDGPIPPEELTCPYGTGSCSVCAGDCSEIVLLPAVGCGDGVVQSEHEACDDGNDVDGDACSSDCQTPAVCGDGVVQGLVEACDHGGAPDAAGDDCAYGSTDCQGCSAACETVELAPHICGDGIVDDGEEACDDGNTDDGDYCAGDCSAATGICGDGIVQANEHCDHGGAPSEACHEGCGGGACVVSATPDLELPTFDTIQAAIDVQGCAPIYVRAGTYEEHLVATRPIELLGDGADVVTIDGADVGRVLDVELWDVDLGVDDVVRLSGLTIQRGLAPRGAGIWGRGGRYDLEAVRVLDNVARCLADGDDAEGGGVLFEEAYVTLIDVEVRGNSALCDDGVGGRALGGGLALVEEGTLMVVGSIIEQNEARAALSAGGGQGDARGGGVFAQETEVVLVDTILSDNVVVAGDDAEGGGVYCDHVRSARLEDVDLVDNRATCGAGGMAAGGGLAGDDFEPLELFGVRAIGNALEVDPALAPQEPDDVRTSLRGAGLAIETEDDTGAEARSTFVNVEIAENTASGGDVAGVEIEGVGLWLESDGVVVRGLGVVRNHASGVSGSSPNELLGGGLYLDVDADDVGEIDIANATFAANSLGGEGVGSQLAVRPSKSGSVALTHVTIADDESSPSGAPLVGVARPTTNTPGSVAPIWLRGSILHSHHSASVCVELGSDGVAPGPVIDVDGASIASDLGGCELSGDAFLHENPSLGPAGSYGGPTSTVGLLDLFGLSAAVDAGGACTTLDGEALLVDQRGEPRDEGACDLGAFELQP